MTDRHFSILAQWCAGLTMGLGLLAGAGWMLDMLLLAQAKTTFIPMAQSTLLSFIALGSGVWARVRWPKSRLVRWWNRIAGSAVLVFSGFLLAQAADGFGADLEELLFGTPGALGSIPMGRMSVVTAGLFVLSSLSVLLSLAGAEKPGTAFLAADILGGGVFISGFTLLIAYLYGTPLLYGGMQVPPALTTALAFVFLGMGLIALKGRSSWPVREFIGASMRAVLLRTFLPFIVIIILLEGWVDAQHWEFLRFNPALLAAIWAVVFTVIVGAVIALLARYRGDELDKAQQALLESEEDTRLNLSLQRLRNEILQMEQEEDWEKVVVAFEDELRSVVRCNACSINLVDLPQEAATLYFTLPGKVGKRATHHLLPALRQALETGQPVYRRNLEDIARSNDEVGQWGQVIQSVVDVPFIGGTIAVNSTEEEAFTQRDIEILEQFAQVISQGYRRLEDLRALARAETRFQQAQKLEAVGQLAGGVAHDFNNLLTIISGYGQFLSRKLEGSPHADDLNQIKQASERGSALVRQLLAFSRKQVLHPTVLNLNIVVSEFEKMLGRLLGEDVAFELHLDGSLGQVFADEGQMQQILMNLAVNARDAMPDGGQLTIETDNVDLKESNGHFLTAAKPSPGRMCGWL